MADPLDRLDEYFSRVRTRLLAGQRAFGDRNFSAEPMVLIEEMSQELEDTLGWGYLLWCRLQEMRQALRDVPAIARVDSSRAARTEHWP